MYQYISTNILAHFVYWWVLFGDVLLIGIYTGQVYWNTCIGLLIYNYKGKSIGIYGMYYI